MLKGLIIQASHTEALEAALTASGLPWRKVPGGSGKAISKASGSLGEPKELLCLVETDAEEKAALEQGFFCIGYLNPDLPGQKLSGCRILLEGFEEIDREFLEQVHTRALGLPVTIAETARLRIREMTLSDLPELNRICRENGLPYVEVSAATGQNTDRLKAEIIRLTPAEFREDPLLAGDLIKPGDTVVLVVPIDLSAPKGRLILPQVQVLREILDGNAVAVVAKEHDLKAALANLKEPPALVITDSQVVMKVAPEVPPEIKMTTFSALFARYKGDIGVFLRGAKKIDELNDGDRILIAEACSHHVQCDDIGRVKIPAWLRQYTGRKLEFEFCSGGDFPEDLEKYALVVHCGACMLNRAEMIRRLKECERRSVAVTNYGIAISKTRGLLERISAPLTA